MNKNTCKICGKDLTIWYCSAGGQTFRGCSDIKCSYKEEINE